jgi:hypothetical protein
METLINESKEHHLFSLHVIPLKENVLGGKNICCVPFLMCFICGRSLQIGNILKRLYIYIYIYIYHM